MPTQPARAQSLIRRESAVCFYLIDALTPHALSAVRASPLHAPVSHRRWAQIRQGRAGARPWRVNRKSHRVPLTRPYAAKNSPASTPLATITGCATRPATTTGASGSLSLTDAMGADEALRLGALRLRDDQNTGDSRRGVGYGARGAGRKGMSTGASRRCCDGLR